jgi:hypothetical protein
MSIYVDIYEAEPTRRIELIRTRVKRSQIRTIAKRLGIRVDMLAANLGIPSGSSEHIPQSSSERVIGLMSIIGCVEAMAIRHGAKSFDAAKWLGAWLDTPLPAL